jgi:RNA polymerase sigma-70 factor (ECF subfamily)
MGMPRDEAWFEGLYERHRAAITAYFVRRVAAHDAGDLVVQVFAVAWDRRDDVPDGSGADDHSLPWLYGVARRVLSHQWRSERRARRLVEKAGLLRQIHPVTPEVATVASAEQQLVRDAVTSLRDADRDVLLLSAWEGLTHAEIAEVLNISTAAVDKRVTRAKARLAERYESLAGTDRPTTGADEPATSSPVRAQEGGGDS